MNGITFDTLNYSKVLREAGMPQEQAEAFTEAQKAVIAEVFAVQDLAKQADVMRLEGKIEDTRHNLEAQIEATKHELDAKIDATKHDLLKWIIGLAFAQMAFDDRASGLSHVR